MYRAHFIWKLSRGATSVNLGAQVSEPQSRDGRTVAVKIETLVWMEISFRR